MAFLNRYTSLMVVVTAALAIMVLIPAVVGQRACNNVSLMANETGMNFSSPNYPLNYTSTANCQWHFTADSPTSLVVMRLLGFYINSSTPCSLDYMNIHDGNSTSAYTIRSLCGIVTSTEFMSTGPFMTIDFQLNGNNTYSFKFQYFSVEKSALCAFSTLTATRTANYITSPGFPYNYPGGLDCQWTIFSGSFSNVVVLKVVDFYLLNSSSCTNDHVIINYGGLSHSTQRLCGQVSNTQIISTESDMTVSFHSNLPRNFIGFALEYTSKEKTELCGSTTLSANGTANYITTPNYPTNYPGDLDCQWTITADSPSRVVVLNVLDFNVEKTSGFCLFDYVDIFNGNSPSKSSSKIQRLCGKVSPVQFSSSGSTLTVVYTSSSYTGFRTFKIEYTSKAPSAVCTENLVANGTAQYFNSPGYNLNYQNNLDCWWTITSDLPSRVVVLEIVYFDVELSSPCNKDFVSIYDGSGKNNSFEGSLCGSHSNIQYISTGSSMTVVFHSDGATNAKGFKFRYYSKVKPGPCGNNSLIASGVASYIKSPNYPKVYDSNTDCQWTIMADLPYKVVELTLLDFYVDNAFSLTCNYDVVTIYDGANAGSHVLQTLCGHLTSGTYRSSGPSMTVVFHSDRSGNQRGFDLQYTSQLKSIECLDVIPLATKTAFTFSSSNYPRLSPSIMTCYWQIYTYIHSVVVLTLDDFNLKGGSCTSEYVKIYDGMTTSARLIETLCGQLSKGQYTSTTPYMTVEFHSEGGNNNNTTGFRFTYQSKNSGVLATAQLTFLSLILIISQLLY